MDGFTPHKTPGGSKTLVADERLRDDNPAVRCDALDALQNRAAPHVIARAAAALLDDPDPGVRERASRLLVALDAPTDAAARVAPYIASPHIATRNLAGEVLVALGPPAVDALAPYLNDRDPHVRKFTIDLLAQLPAESLVDAIATALDDADANVRLAAVGALGALRASTYSEALIALYDREPLARPDIIHAMGAFGEAADLDLLERGLTDENPVVQLASAEALASQDAPEVLEFLLKQVESVNPMARPIVLHSIVTLCTTYPRYQDQLPATLKERFLTMLGDMDASYRCAAARGLRWFVDDAVCEAMLAHAGMDEALDMELFTTLLQHPQPFSPLSRAADSGRMPASTAATFAVGFLARDALSEATYRRIGPFLQRHFGTLSVDDKITTVGLCQRIAHPELRGVIQTAQSDPNAKVRTLATDAAEPSSTPAPH